MLDRVGRATARHPLRTIACWVVTCLALMALGQAIGGSFVNDFRFPGTDAQQASDLAVEHFPEYGVSSADIVFASENGLISDQRAALDETLAAIRLQPRVVEVSELTTSSDGVVATSTIQYDGEVGDLGTEPYVRLQSAAAIARNAGLTVEFRGMVIDAATEPTTGVAELVGPASTTPSLS